jgi:hypothetical protein
MLLGFFTLFCLLVAAAGYTGWRYYSLATLSIDDLQAQHQVRVHAKAGVLYQVKGSSELITPQKPCADTTSNAQDMCFDLNEGYRIKTVPEAGYGPVASLVLPDETHVDLWAHPIGADVLLERYQVTRWNSQRQEVLFRQEAGYARYDLKGDQPYSQVSYSVQITNGLRISLIPGGSYSINVPRSSPGKLATLTDSSAPMLVEVAARSGRAIVESGRQRVAITAGKKAQIDIAKAVGKPTAAAWELIDDGSFARYPREKYDESSDAWVIVSSPLVQPMDEPPGVFTAIQECPPLKVDNCSPKSQPHAEAADQIYVAQFRRGEGLSKPYMTGISQTLDVDVSEFTRSLHFSAWTRVLTQTIESAGIDGTECPIMITLKYKMTSPTDTEDSYTTCVYTGPQTKFQGSGIHQYIRVKQFDWQRIDIEFRDNRSPLKRARYLQQIMIEARGHDYLSEITAVSLMGTE